MVSKQLKECKECDHCKDIQINGIIMLSQQISFFLFQCCSKFRLFTQVLADFLIGKNGTNVWKVDKRTGVLFIYTE